MSRKMLSIPVLVSLVVLVAGSVEAPPPESASGWLGLSASVPSRSCGSGRWQAGHVLPEGRLGRRSQRLEAAVGPSGPQPGGGSLLRAWQRRARDNRQWLACRSLRLGL